MTVFDFSWRRPDGVIKDDISLTIAKLVDEKSFTKYGGCSIGCVFTNGELLELENMINEEARILKNNLLPDQLGSSVKEI